MKNNKILIIDPSSWIGHVKIDSCYLNLFKINNIDFDFLTSQEFANNINMPELSIIKYKFLKNYDRRNKYTIFLGNFYLTLIAFFKMKKYDKILFLSYEPFSFLFISFFFKKNKNIFLISHALDSISNNKKRLFCLKVLSKKFCNIVLSKYIAKGLFKKYSVKCSSLPHPVMWSNRKENNKKTKTIFCGSGGNKLEDILKLDNKLDGSYNLIIKTYEDINFETKNKSIKSKFFDNYKQILKDSEFAFFSIDYNYRVSGVFYEVMSYECIVISTECPFMRYMQTKYPNAIIIIDLNKSISLNYNYDLAKHDFNKFKEDYSDERIMNKLKKIMQV